MPRIPATGTGSPAVPAPPGEEPPATLLPAPPGGPRSVTHQRAARRLLALLDDAAREAGAEVEALPAVAVRLPDGFAVPDLVVADAAAVRRAAAGAGAALDARDVRVAVEIVSPDTRVADHTVRPALYAAAGIPQLWQLELAPLPLFRAGRLRRGVYEETAAALGGFAVRVEEPFPAAIDPGVLTRSR
ncbi:Uma2 family endonuclease [Streptomyces sp. 7-21]|uniref:Uma2 family endonuclease n=1 Tax=Streptomyces sp. 7-21 TaxID=2802283 RepID=UPI001920313D|nr:Uma2 family endonuclease [Streptomyces sp. 7-21]MBL1065977.1 Uma2 family endonuclease [Streptomyces sp. 7-21]